MEKADVVVIGGSAAGPVAGISCRRRHPEKKVILIRKEEQVLVPCGIPYIFGTVGSPEKNLIPDALLSNNGIGLIKGEVVEINRDKKNVSTSSGDVVSYDKLILATGSLPVVLPIPGLEKENVFMAKKDVAYLKTMLDAVKGKEIVVIGGGFIGVEFADECKKNPASKVTIVEILPRCLQVALDEEFCDEAGNALTERGIKVLINQRVEAVLGDEKVSGVRLTNGEELNADVVIVAVGATPNTELAVKAGLQIGPTRAIQVDRCMRTIADPHIFACGDCAEKFSFFSGRVSRLMLASIACTEARIAAANLFDTRCYNRGAIGVFSTIIGEQALGAVGLGEAVARQEGFEIVVGTSASPDRHPGSMPGATGTKVKLIFTKGSGLLLGGGVSGGRGVGELINVISGCIQCGLTAYDIAVFQIGTHPALTASPIAYQLVNAAELAVAKL